MTSSHLIPFTHCLTCDTVRPRPTGHLACQGAVTAASAKVRWTGKWPLNVAWRCASMPWFSACLLNAKNIAKMCYQYIQYNYKTKIMASKRVEFLTTICLAFLATASRFEGDCLPSNVWLPNSPRPPHPAAWSSSRDAWRQRSCC